jgi:replicative DNA helicase
MNPNIDNLPPHDMPAEQGALGCCMLDPKAHDHAIEQGVDPSWFYDLRHSTLWEELGKMAQSGNPTYDIVAVGSWLRSRGLLEGLGGLAYLSELMDAVPSAANLPYYLGILSGKAKLRKLLEAASAIIQSVRETPEDPETAIAEAETAILGIRGAEVVRNDSSAKQIAQKAIAALEDRMAGSVERITTGWRSLDAITKGGWKPGNMIVIAGRPGTGKTALAVTAARLTARAGIPVGIISLEMSDEELGGRFLAQESRLDWGRFDDRWRPTEDQSRRMTVGASAFARLPITVHEGHAVTISAIAAKARRWKRSNGMRLLVIDYLQLVNGNPKRSREEQVSEISRGVKGIARELRIPVMVLAQLNREMEKDKNRKPRLSDLRESGAIEQDADFVGMLYRSNAPDSRLEEDPNDIEVNLHVAKNRAGRAGGDVCFMFNRELTEFAEIERERPE